MKKYCVVFCGTFQLSEGGGKGLQTFCVMFCGTFQLSEEGGKAYKSVMSCSVVPSNYISEGGGKGSKVRSRVLWYLAQCLGGSEGSILCHVLWYLAHCLGKSRGSILSDFLCSTGKFACARLEPVAYCAKSCFFR